MSCLKSLQRSGASYVRRYHKQQSLWRKQLIQYQKRSVFQMQRNRSFLIYHNKRYFSDRAGSGIHPDFQTSYKTGDVDQVKKQIEADVKNNAIFLFMKGTPTMPQCGFSKNLITVLNYLEVEYETRDVLSHPALRQAVKEYRFFIYIYIHSILLCNHTLYLLHNTVIGLLSLNYTLTVN